jgi:Flp pilus assembly protein CpaB
LALAGALLVLLYVISYRHDVQNGAGLVDIYVASRDIPEGTDGATVASSYLKKQSVLKRNVVGGAISQTSQIASASLAANETIYAGEQISTRQFRSAAQQGILANISGLTRAMTVPGDPNKLLAGIVNDGDHVDILATIGYSLRPPTGATVTGDLHRTATRIILRNIMVLRAPAVTTTGGIANNSTTSNSITLALTDAQSQKMLFAMQSGNWWLVLRPVAHPANSSESIETLKTLLSDGLSPKVQSELTNGYGPGSISSGG